MSKRVPSVALVLGLLLAACGSEPPTAQQVKTEFVPQTVEFLDDVGKGMSVALDKDGNPHVSYVGFVEQVEEGEIPPARPATAPALPAVLYASVKDGIFTRGAVVQTDISTANPVAVPVTASSTTGIAVAESGAVDVVWNQFRGVFFATAPSASAPFGEPITVAEVYGTAPAIALDADGNPWVAFVATDGSGVPSVEVATLDEKGDKFAEAEVVATLDKCDVAECTPLSVDIAFAGDDPVIAYTDPATGSAVAATRVGTSWGNHTVERGVTASGISLTAAENGSLLMAYLTPGTVRLGTSADGSTWTVTRAATFESKERQGMGGATAIGAGKGKVYLAYTDPDDVSLVLESHEGDDPFKPVATPGTSDGLYPALAVDADGKANLAWYDSSAEDAMLGQVPTELGAIAVPAPSSAAPTGGGGPAPELKCPNNTVEIVAPPGAAGTGFDPTQVDAPGGDFTVCFKNEDPQTHNVAIYQDQAAASSPDNALASDPVFQGPKVDTFDVSGLDPGDYYFHCDVHPSTMTGTLTVA